MINATDSGKVKTIIVAGVLLVAIMSAMVCFHAFDSRGAQYIRGVHGKYCYTEFNVPKQIKYKLYFKSLSECVKSLEKK